MKLFSEWNYYETNSPHVFLFIILIRCGNGLVQLYNSPRVQMFLNCLSSKEVYSTKPIYQPGCLRKVLYDLFDVR